MCDQALDDDIHMMYEIDSDLEDCVEHELDTVLDDFMDGAVEESFRFSLLGYSAQRREDTTASILEASLACAPERTERTTAESMCTSSSVNENTIAIHFPFSASCACRARSSRCAGELLGEEVQRHVRCDHMARIFGSFVPARCAGALEPGFLPMNLLRCRLAWGASSNRVGTHKLKRSRRAENDTIPLHTL
eukprot:5924313-Pyramimonas_sp.AAC.1